MKLKLIALIITPLLSISFTYGQGQITIDHKTQRFVNKESSLNRSKYFNIHQLTKLNDPELIQFKNTYGMAANYRGGRLLDSPMKNHNRTGNFPNIITNFTGVREVENRFASTGPSDYFYDANADYSTEDMTTYIDELTTYMTEFYKSQDTKVPRFIEPLNEPMIHTNEYYPEGRMGNINRSKRAILNTRICELHRELGKKIHATPELINMKVAGFGSAFPSFENNNFTLWNERYKKFIDIAGKNVDVMTVHLYDGIGVNNNGGRRSGSNVEAIMDMIEAYSSIKLNVIKPLAITEYGRLVPDQPGYPGNGTVVNYEPVENAQAVRSQIHMCMSLMERGGDMIYSIPFTMNKTKPTGVFSKSSLWNRVSTNPVKWDYSSRVNFFEIWKGIKGERVLINSDNIDVQTQAFVDGNKLFVVTNNLNDITQTLNLNLLNPNGLQNVLIRRLKIFTDKIPELTENTQNNAPTSLSLEYGETAVLIYTFDKPIAFENKIRSKKYYASTYLQPISANKKNTFSFSNVAIGTGQAVLRVGVGRNLGRSLSPKIRINGTNITLPRDIIRGYDQNNRSRFFGTLEIPIPMTTLKAGDNLVDVEFTDNSGHISSVILQIQKFDNDTALSSPTLLTSNTISNLSVYPNPLSRNKLLNIKVPNKGNPTIITIFDIQGNLVYNNTFDKQKTSISLNNLTQGVYFLHIESNQNKIIKKLLIQ